MVITVSGGLGVGETAFVAELAARVALPVLSRDAIAAALGQSPMVVAGDTDELVPSEAGFRAWFRGDRRVGDALAGRLWAMLANRDAIVVGWGGADVFGKRPAAVHLRLVATLTDRCRRVAEQRSLDEAAASRAVADSDAHRAEFHQRLFGTGWADARRYHAVLNLSRLDVTAAADLAARLIAAAGGPAPVRPTDGPTWRQVTISRQFGAGGAELGELLSAVLGWPTYDRQLLHQSGGLAGLALPALVHLDEHGPGFLERLRLLQGSASYFAGLRQAIAAAVEAGPAVLVGRGASFLVPGDAALHLRLVADDADRQERIMRRRWLAAAAAATLIRDEDRARAEFHRHFFGADGSEPTLYHLTLSSSRLPLTALADAIARYVCDCRPRQEGEP